MTSTSGPVANALHALFRTPSIASQPQSSWCPYDAHSTWDTTHPVVGLASTPLNYRHHIAALTRPYGRFANVHSRFGGEPRIVALVSLSAAHQRIPPYPGFRFPEFNEFVHPSCVFGDGSQGAFEARRYPQEFDSTRPWLAFHEHDQSVHASARRIEHWNAADFFDFNGVLETSMKGGHWRDHDLQTLTNRRADAEKFLINLLPKDLNGLTVQAHLETFRSTLPFYEPFDLSDMRHWTTWVEGRDIVARLLRYTCEVLAIVRWVSKLRRPNDPQRTEMMGLWTGQITSQSDWDFFLTANVPLYAVFDVPSTHPLHAIAVSQGLTSSLDGDERLRNDSFATALPFPGLPIDTYGATTRQCRSVPRFNPRPIFRQAKTTLPEQFSSLNPPSGRLELPPRIPRASPHLSWNTYLYDDRQISRAHTTPPKEVASLLRRRWTHIMTYSSNPSPLTGVNVESGLRLAIHPIRTVIPKRPNHIGNRRRHYEEKSNDTYHWPESLGNNRVRDTLEVYRQLEEEGNGFVYDIGDNDFLLTIYPWPTISTYPTSGISDQRNYVAKAPPDTTPPRVDTRPARISLTDGFDGTWGAGPTSRCGWGATDSGADVWTTVWNIGNLQDEPERQQQQHHPQAGAIAHVSAPSSSDHLNVQRSSTPAAVHAALPTRPPQQLPTAERLRAPSVSSRPAPTLGSSRRRDPPEARPRQSRRGASYRQTRQYDSRSRSRSHPRSRSPSRRPHPSSRSRSPRRRDDSYSSPSTYRPPSRGSRSLGRQRSPSPRSRTTYISRREPRTPSPRRDTYPSRREPRTPSPRRPYSQFPPYQNSRENSPSALQTTRSSYRSQSPPRARRSRSPAERHPLPSSNEYSSPPADWPASSTVYPHPSQLSDGRDASVEWATMDVDSTGTPASSPLRSLLVSTFWQTQSLDVVQIREGRLRAEAYLRYRLNTSLAPTTVSTLGFVEPERYSVVEAVYTHPKTRHTILCYPIRIANARFDYSTNADETYNQCMDLAAAAGMGEIILLAFNVEVDGTLTIDVGFRFAEDAFCAWARDGCRAFGTSHSRIVPITAIVGQARIQASTPASRPKHTRILLLKDALDAESKILAGSATDDIRGDCHSQMQTFYRHLVNWAGVDDVESPPPPGNLGDAFRKIHPNPCSGDWTQDPFLLSSSGIRWQKSWTLPPTRPSRPPRRAPLYIPTTETPQFEQSSHQMNSDELRSAWRKTIEIATRRWQRWNAYPDIIALPPLPASFIGVVSDGNNTQCTAERHVPRYLELWQWYDDCAREVDSLIGQVVVPDDPLEEELVRDMFDRLPRISSEEERFAIARRISLESLKHCLSPPRRLQLLYGPSYLIILTAITLSLS